MQNSTTWQHAIHSIAPLGKPVPQNAATLLAKLLESAQTHNKQETCVNLLAVAHVAQQIEAKEILDAAISALEKYVSLDTAMHILKHLRQEYSTLNKSAGKIRTRCWKALRVLDSDEFAREMENWLFNNDDQQQQHVQQ